MMEGAEGWDIQLICDALDIEVTLDFVTERSHRTSQRGSREWHLPGLTSQGGGVVSSLREGTSDLGKQISIFSPRIGHRTSLREAEKFDVAAVSRVVADNIRHTFTSPEEVVFCQEPDKVQEGWGWLRDLDRPCPDLAVSCWLGTSGQIILLKHSRWCSCLKYAEAAGHDSAKLKWNF